MADLPASTIQLEGVRVHNLKNIALRIRRSSLTVICGVSGSGKSSLAFDTLFAEGQRRYVETFSPYARQFLDRVERPDADRIDGIPPAIAIQQNARSQGARSTVGTRTEILNYLRVLFAKAGNVVCSACDIAAASMTADTAAEHLLQQADGQRAMLAFDVEFDPAALQQLLSLGFSRCVAEGVSTTLDELLKNDVQTKASLLVVADRIRVERNSLARMAESIEQIFATSDGRCVALIQTSAKEHATLQIDNAPWLRLPLSQHLLCQSCGQEFALPSSEQLNFQSPLGACPTCEGTGQISGMSFERVVPDSSRSLQDGAIQPWTTPAYRHELDELLALAAEYQIPVDVPFDRLSGQHRRIIHEGVPERSFGGLIGFHRWLVRNRYKRGVSVFLNRWRSWLLCPDCQGSRLIAAASSVRLNGLNISNATGQELGQLSDWIQTVVSDLPTTMAGALSAPIRQLTSRLQFLNDSGLGYLSLDRPMKTLSGGEAQRVVLTAALGSGLINTLYVLDEPTSGLHATDALKIISATRKLQQLGNTVVVVEHDPDFINAADEVIEIGPGAGAAGGEVVFQGSPAELTENLSTATGISLALVRKTAAEATRSARAGQRTPSTWLTFQGVTCHNIQRLSGRLPLEVICAVTGVSGSGKSSLIVDALYPEICRQLRKPCDLGADCHVDHLNGVDQISDVCLLDQSPLRGSRRSVPATTIGCFNEIREVLSRTHEAKKRNYKPGLFSFNSAQGGRCPACSGHGVVTVEMQFLADIQTRCEACSGRRFRPDVLDVRYRDRNIHDILQMTVEQAFTFFNGHRRIQQRLNALRQAGLGYIRLGQPVATLSGGESQRLRIAALLAGVALSSDELPVSARKTTNQQIPRTLFLLDEPSTGLHLQDIASLMKCLNHLVEIGHSVIVIEHDPEVIRHADHIVELGPGPGRDGGQIICAG